MNQFPNVFNKCAITVQWAGISWHALLFLSSVLVYNKWTNCLLVYKHLLINNRLLHKTADLCLVLTAEITV